MYLCLVDHIPWKSQDFQSDSLTNHSSAGAGESGVEGDKGGDSAGADWGEAEASMGVDGGEEDDSTGVVDGEEEDSIVVISKVLWSHSLR